MHLEAADLSGMHGSTGSAQVPLDEFYQERRRGPAEAAPDQPQGQQSPSLRQLRPAQPAAPLRLPLPKDSPQLAAMRSLLACLLVALCVAAAAAHPGPRVRRYAQPAHHDVQRLLPRHHYPHGGGGFRHYVPRNYEPEAPMTAFAAGNTVSAGSYYGSNAEAAGRGARVRPVATATATATAQTARNGNGHGNAIRRDEPAPARPEVILSTAAAARPARRAAGRRRAAYPGDEPTPRDAEQPATEAPAFDSADPQEAQRTRPPRPSTVSPAATPPRRGRFKI
ncbi:Protein of unknown function [Gryllus bimaculatus]|nr:Protein of unknown function [Gryllus bimaculatus]